MKKLFGFLGLLFLSFNIQAQEYVDLGLSVNWAAYNVGANSIEEIGETFVPGAMEPFTSGMNMKAYCMPYQNKQSGNPDYDVATARWGRGWRTPTQQEWEELMRRCKWKRSVIILNNGVKIKGYEVRGRNGNSIFLHDHRFSNGVSAITYYMADTHLHSYLLNKGCLVGAGIMTSKQGPKAVEYWRGVSVRPVIDKIN